MATVVDIEIGAKRVFAWAVDWPGWCRSGRTEEAALAALADYVPRYAAVPARAGVRYPKSAGHAFEVRERLPGDASTEFGIPGQVSGGDTAPVRRAEAARTGRLLTAAWGVLDEVAAVTPAQLRKGPRGGGRDRDKMLGHVVDAEAAYARMIGIRRPAPPFDDREAVAALRAEILAALSRPSDGTPLRPKGWPARYAARRVAWHVLDHAWEMQDRTEPPS